MAEFGENVRRLREAKGLTQQSLADQLYVTRQAVSRWEGGSRYPDLMTAKKLAEALDSSMDALLSQEDMKQYAQKAPVLESTVAKGAQTAALAFGFAGYLVRVRPKGPGAGIAGGEGRADGGAGLWLRGLPGPTPVVCDRASGCERLVRVPCRRRSGTQGSIDDCAVRIWHADVDSGPVDAESGRGHCRGSLRKHSAGGRVFYDTSVREHNDYTAQGADWRLRRLVFPA